MQPEEVSVQSGGQCAAGVPALGRALLPTVTEGQFGVSCDYVTPVLSSAAVG